jgi:hypothetical protein
MIQPGFHEGQSVTARFSAWVAMTLIVLASLESS